MLSKDSDEYRILVALCRMPRPVRGMSEAMLLRDFKSGRPIQTLASQGLIRRRGWYDGPGGIWVPTKQGEDLVGAAD
jgi:hypothetical protein